MPILEWQGKGLRTFSGDVYLLEVLHKYSIIFETCHRILVVLHSNGKILDI